ncbi:MAG: hypothetical protein K2M46_02270 [Lachnospiraceae bacterium]|nr:hypothetical protein [Lachnospiraceae bacterium]
MKKIIFLLCIMAFNLCGCSLSENNSISDNDLPQEQRETDKSISDTDNMFLYTPIPTEPEEEEVLEEYECGLIEEFVAAQEQDVEMTVRPKEAAEVYEDLSSLPQEIQDVLYENANFYEVYDQKEYTRLTYDGSHYKRTEISETAEWGHYMVFDLDKDGEKELAVLMQESHSNAFIEVFDKQEEQVYAYEIPYRGFIRVFTDGAIYGASAFDTWDYCILHFDGNKLTNKVIAGAKHDKFQVIGKEVTEEEFCNYEGRYFDMENDDPEFNDKVTIPWSNHKLDDILSE